MLKRIIIHLYLPIWCFLITLFVITQYYFVIIIFYYYNNKKNRYFSIVKIYNLI